MDSEKYFLGAAVVLSYLIGSIPFGYLIGKFNGVDIRNHGSGNIGATNVLRTLGRKWGYLCFSLDFLKGFLPVLLVVIFSKDKFGESSPHLFSACVMMAAFCGHVWPIFLGFKGGKGVATAGGAIFAISPFAFMVSLVVWVCVFSASKYVSLGSIVASLTLPLAYFLAGKYGNSTYSNIILAVFAFISILSVIKHRSNIRRLWNGTEMRFGKEEK